MEICFRCNRNEKEVRLYEGIYINDIIKVCEKCAILSSIPIIKTPSSEQLKTSEKPYGVRERLLNLRGIEEKKETQNLDELKKIEEKPELEKPEDLVFKLVENFHWAIQTQRRRKGLSTKQLADSIAESETAIKMLEKGIIPSDSLNLIIKIEQFLKIELVKKDSIERLREIEEEEKLLKRDLTENPIGRTIETQTQAKLPPKKDLALSFSRKEAEQFQIKDLQRLNENIEKDFTSYKSREQVGNEQIEDFGKEDLSKIKSKIYPENKQNKTPTIYELLKIKQEKEKHVLGGDINIDDKSKKTEETQEFLM